MRPLILDLFCGAGLVARGLKKAGLVPVGVDLHPQKAYPGAFIQHDALTLDERFLDLFPFIWASPECLRETEMRSAPGAKGLAHPDLITPTQKMLDAWAARTGGKFVIENVRNTKLLRNPVTLCGSMFDLGADDGGTRYHLERHRKFETNWTLFPPRPCAHQKPVVGVYGGHARVRARAAGGRSTKEPWTRPGVDIMHEAMGLEDRLTCEEISQGVPPVYAEYVAKEMVSVAQHEGWGVT